MPETTTREEIARAVDAPETFDKPFFGERFNLENARSFKPDVTMEPVGIMEALSDTEEWLNWARHFGPTSYWTRAWTRLINMSPQYGQSLTCDSAAFMASLVVRSK